MIPAGRSGVWGGEPLDVTLVEPSLVVEVLADTAQERGHWRHVVRYVRVRPELHPEEILPPSGNAESAGAATAANDEAVGGPGTTQAG